jgi:hypothetical protein
MFTPQKHSFYPAQGGTRGCRKQGFNKVLKPWRDRARLKILLGFLFDKIRIDSKSCSFD